MLLGCFLFLLDHYKTNIGSGSKFIQDLGYLRWKAIFVFQTDVNFIANKSDINRGSKNFLLLADHKLIKQHKLITNVN